MCAAAGSSAAKKAVGTEESEFGLAVFTGLLKMYGSSGDALKLLKAGWLGEPY
jgi:hypothetical protein